MHSHKACTETHVPCISVSSPKRLPPQTAHAPGHKEHLVPAKGLVKALAAKGGVAIEAKAYPFYPRLSISFPVRHVYSHLHVRNYRQAVLCDHK